MINELLPEDRRRLNELELQLLEIEKGNPNIRISDVSIGLQEMSNRLDDLDRLASRESKLRRDDMKRRVQHLRVSYNHIKAHLDGIFQKRSELDFEAQKIELLGERSRDRTNISKFDSEAAEGSSLSRSGQMIREYLVIGQETLSDLISQKERLKYVQRRLLDIMSLLGVSNSIMRAVERRDFVDRWIVIVGIVLVSLLLFSVYWFLR